MGVFDRITIEPGKMGGQPCIRGHRFTVEHLLGLVGAGWTLEQIQEDFPFVEAADIQQAGSSEPVTWRAPPGFACFSADIARLYGVGA